MITPQVADANRLVQRADAFCLTDPTCPFHGQGNGSVVKVCTCISSDKDSLDMILFLQAWETVLTQAIQAPLPALSCGPGTGCNSPVTATDLRQGLAFMFRSNPDFPLFAAALNASLHGDASLFAYQPLVDIRESVVTPLLCSDLSALVFLPSRFSG